MGRTLLILLLTCLTGCASVGWGEATVGDRAAAGGEVEAMTLEELDQLVLAYADRYAAAVAAACDEIAENVGPERRAEASRIKSLATTNLYNIASNPDPYTKLLDVVLVVTLQSKQLIDENGAYEMFGPEGDALAQAIRTMRQEAWDLAARVQTREQLATLDRLIWKWRRDNPDVRYVSLIRFEDISSSRGKSVIADAKSAPGLFGIGDLQKAGEEYRLLAERALYLGKRQPILVNWQVQSLVDDLMARPQIADTLDGVNATLDNVETLTAQVDALPDMLADQQGELRQTLAGVDETVAGVNEAIGSTNELATTIDGTTATALEIVRELNRTTQTLQQTIESAGGVMRELNAGPAAPLLDEDGEPVAAKPFDIVEYTAAAEELTRALAEARGIITDGNALLASDDWTARLDEVNAAAERRVDHATEQADALVGASVSSVFWHATAFAVVVFVLLVLYQFLTARIRGAHPPRGVAA